MPKFLKLARVMTIAGLGVMLAPALPLEGQDRPRPLLDRLAPRRAPMTTAPPASTVAPTPAAETPTTVSPFTTKGTTAEQSADEVAIRQSAAMFTKAYAAGDARQIAAMVSPDAEYVDEDGNVIEGRQAIEDSLTEFFKEHPSCLLEMRIETLRFVAPGVAIEDGITTARISEDATPIETRYTTVHAKTDGKWLAVSIRDHASQGGRQHHTQLEQLNWLIGDWVDEGEDAVVAFSCKPSDNGKFLTRTFSIQVAGQEALSGTQRIGWDPLTGKLRTWIFDSEGGFGEGFWHRRGDDWVLKLTGVSADGEPASSTSIYSLVNGHLMTWQAVDHEVGGVELPDSEVITIVRTSPAPELTEAEPQLPQGSK